MADRGSIDVRRLLPRDAAAYRILRLDALRLHPDAFGSSFEEEVVLNNAAFAQKLSDGPIFGALCGGRLVGSAGLALRQKRKLRHKGILWGMFVVPEMRGRGVGKRLLDEVLAHAWTCCEEVLLTVVVGNHEATKLYAAAGFIEYGWEPRAVKIGADYHDERMMRLPIRS